MKDLYYTDKRHGNLIIVKSPKSRKAAQNKIMEEYVPKMFDWSTIEEMVEFEDYFYEFDGDVIKLNT